MLEEKYLKDFDQIDLNKPKAKKIIYHFLRDLYRFQQEYKKLCENANSEKEIDFINNNTTLSLVCNLADHFVKYDKATKTYTLKNNNIKLYKNVYDEFFIYNINYNERKEVTLESVFLLNEKNRLEINNKKVFYFSLTPDSFKQTYRYYGNNSCYTCQYKSSYINYYNRSYNKESKDKKKELDLIKYNTFEQSDTHLKVLHFNNMSLQSELGRNYNYISLKDYENNNSTYLELNSSKELTFALKKANVSVEIGFSVDFYALQLFYHEGEEQNTLLEKTIHIKPDEVEVVDVQSEFINSLNTFGYELEFLMLTRDIDLNVSEKKFFECIVENSSHLLSTLKNFNAYKKFEASLVEKDLSNLDKKLFKNNNSMILKIK